MPEPTGRAAEVVGPCTAPPYQYNAVGELVRMGDWLGATTFELDLLNQLTRVTDHNWTGSTMSIFTARILTASRETQKLQYIL